MSTPHTTGKLTGKRDPTSPLESDESKKSRNWSDIVSGVPCPESAVTNVSITPIPEAVHENWEMDNASAVPPAVPGPSTFSGTHLTLDPASIIAISDLVIANLTPKINDIVRSSVEQAIGHLNQQVEKLTDDQTKFRQENAFLKSRLNRLESQVDEMEQYSRRNIIRVSGATELPNENTDAIIMDLAKDLGTDLILSDIDRCHRVGAFQAGRPRPIIVKFTSYRAREKLFSKRRELKNIPRMSRVFMNEDLTYRRNQLMYEARQAVRSKHIISAWSSDGKLFVRDKRDIRCKLVEDGDLQRIIQNSQ